MVVLLAVAVLGVAAAFVVWRQGRSHPSGAWARPLQWGALLAAAVAAVGVWSATWSDSGAFTFVALGVPVFLAAAALGIPEQARWGRVGVWLCALLLLGWALLLGLGVGLGFVPAAMLLLAAATVSNGGGPGGSGRRA